MNIPWGLIALLVSWLIAGYNDKKMSRNSNNAGYDIQFFLPMSYVPIVVFRASILPSMWPCNPVYCAETDEFVEGGSPLLWQQTFGGQLADNAGPPTPNNGVDQPLQEAVIPLDDFEATNARLWAEDSPTISRQPSPQPAADRGSDPTFERTIAGVWREDSPDLPRQLSPSPAANRDSNPAFERTIGSVWGQDFQGGQELTRATTPQLAPTRYTDLNFERTNAALWEEDFQGGQELTRATTPQFAPTRHTDLNFERTNAALWEEDSPVVSPARSPQESLDRSANDQQNEIYQLRLGDLTIHRQAIRDNTMAAVASPDIFNQGEVFGQELENLGGTTVPDVSFFADLASSTPANSTVEVFDDRQTTTHEQVFTWSFPPAIQAFARNMSVETRPGQSEGTADESILWAADLEVYED
ncbi:hypothetical protein VTL71DRAFT_9403 [Oculimacula yallundae]|uniref:Secreted protein n=1 Tax=Oculimacula yallundae TaxID=86028 RepID=A0ABR4BSZ2_9HELO